MSDGGRGPDVRLPEDGRPAGYPPADSRASRAGRDADSRASLAGRDEVTRDRVRVRRGGAWRTGLLAAAALVAVVALMLVLSAVRLLPSLRNPFAETTVNRSQPALLKSVTSLSRFEAASGSFQVIVDLAQRSSFLPSFVEGTDTLFVGSGTDTAYVDFSGLKRSAIAVTDHRRAVTVTLPPARLEPAVLNVRRSYVFAQQQGLLNRIGDFFSSNPDSQHQVYVLAQREIQDAARRSPLVAQAEASTRAMLSRLLRSLGFRKVTVIFSPG